MAGKILFVTGADTGVGKTVVGALLTRHLRAAGLRVVALKPICSGGRGDARRLCDAAGGAIPLEEVNPWHFRAALAPVLAAREEGRRVRLSEVARHVRSVSRLFEVVVVEGAGGLLSPLGTDFDSLDLLLSLGGQPIVVAPNRLGAVGQVRLVLAALPSAVEARARIVLSAPIKPDLATGTNARLLAEFVPRARVHLLPRLAEPFPARLIPALRALVARLVP